MPLKISVAGDLGQTSDSRMTLQHMLDDQNTQFAVIAGDVSYSDCLPKRWDSSLEMLQPLASWKQLMVGPGNHEIEYMTTTQMAFQVMCNV
jgi:acid phosphatase type 7